MLRSDLLSGPPSLVACEISIPLMRPAQGGCANQFQDSLDGRRMSTERPLLPPDPARLSTSCPPVRPQYFASLTGAPDGVTTNHSPNSTGGGPAPPGPWGGQPLALVTVCAMASWDEVRQIALAVRPDRAPPGRAPRAARRSLARPSTEASRRVLSRHEKLTGPSTATMCFTRPECWYVQPSRAKGWRPSS
jgi:hypothetical protein